MERDRETERHQQRDRVKQNLRDSQKEPTEIANTKRKTYRRETQTERQRATE